MDTTYALLRLWGLWGLSQGETEPMSVEVRHFYLRDLSIVDCRRRYGHTELFPTFSISSRQGYGLIHVSRSTSHLPGHLATNADSEVGDDRHPGHFLLL